ncbi:MAG: TonB C-terminal domain-containing protein [Victivallaceae bacterium]
MQEFSTQILNNDNNGWGKITLPPLVAPSTKRKICYSVITAHLLFIGIPLAVMSIMNWINPQPEKLMVIEMAQDLPYNPAPYSPEPPTPQEPAPEPPTPQEPAPQEPSPTPPTIDYASVPLPPSVIDNQPEPEPDPIPKPEKQKPKPKQEPEKQKPKPEKKNNNSKVGKPMSADDLNKMVNRRTGTQNTDPNAKTDFSKPINNGVSGKFASQLSSFIRVKWQPLIPNENQLGGRKPQATLVLAISRSGKITKAVMKSPSGIAAMDNAVRKLCAELEGSQAPRPDGDIEIEIILKSEY